MITTADTLLHQVSRRFQSSQTTIAGASRRAFSVADAQRAQHVDVDARAG